MKARWVGRAVSLGLVLAGCGCQYQVPLSEAPSGTLDRSVLGVWEHVESEGETGATHRMLVLAFGEAEFLVIYPTGAEAMYFRAYPVAVDGLALVQLQWLGYSGRPLRETDKPYHVCRIELEDDELLVRTLNPLVVPPDVTDSAALREAIAAHAGEAALFGPPQRFRRAAPPAP